MRKRRTLPSLEALGLLILAACGGEGTSVELRSGVLITLDTTTAPALDCYGKDRGVTPALAELARESVIHENAWSVAPLTLPAHASALTGLYPPRHTVRDNGHLPLPASAETVAERARAAGYRTAAFVAATVLGPEYGLGQGFDVFDAPVGKREDEAGMLDRPGTEITRAAVRWLDERTAGQPYLLWVHYFDPHAPYEPPPRHLEQAGGRPYLGEVSAMDQAVGDLLARLAVEPDWGETAVVVVADHGESHGRHGENSHGLLLYDATLRVPLLVRHPGGAGAGTRSGEIASLVDVAPTLLHAMNLGELSGIDGRALVPGREPEERGVYLEAYMGFMSFGWSPLAGWVDGESKYIHATSPELYDLGADPDETRNLFRGDDPRVARARKAIDELVARPALERTVAERTGVVGAEDLAALGYAASASPVEAIPHPLEPPSGAPVPVDSLQEFYAVNSAMAAAHFGKKEEGIAALEQVVAGNPRNALAVRMLAGYLVEVGRPRRALAPMEKLLALDYDSPNLRQRMAEALSRLGRFDEALEHLRRAEELRPGDPGVAELRERCLALREAGDEGDGGDGE